MRWSGHWLRRRQVGFLHLRPHAGPPNSGGRNLLAGLIVALATTAAVAQQNRYIVNKAVPIPFSPAPGINVAREALSLDPGTYVITVRVVRAGWDQEANSVAEAIPVGLQWLIQDQTTGEDVNKSRRATGQGKVGMRVNVPQNARCIVFYSTISPAGAMGYLTVER
jgi:hypothetical protein